MKGTKKISALAKLAMCVSVLGSIGLYSLYVPNAYEVYVNGRAVACVRDINAADAITNMVYSELCSRFSDLVIDKDTVYLSVIANKEAMSSEQDIRNNIINALNTKVKAVEMSIDGSKVAILANEKEGQKVIELVTKHFSTKEGPNNSKFSAISSDVKYKSVDTLVSQVDVVEGTVGKLVANTEKGLQPGVKISYKSAVEKSSNVSMAVPSRGSISSSFGQRWGRMHEGIDIAANTGEPIYAAMDGKVVYSGWANGYGKMIRIQHKNNIETIYGHCSRLRVAVGTSVKKGQLIGDVGSTGNSTGPHLHFEVRIQGKPVNPYPYIYKK